VIRLPGALSSRTGTDGSGAWYVAASDRQIVFAETYRTIN